MPSHHILVLVLQFWQGHCLRGRICNDAPIFATNLPACAGSWGVYKFWYGKHQNFI
jgi:hypothetical protein